MSKITVLLAAIFLFISSYTSAQYRAENNSIKNWEIRMGAEVNRWVPSVGIALNYNFSEYASLAPELLLLGSPILGGTLRLNFPITKRLKLSPHVGGGFTPVAFLVSTVGIVGLNISYSLSDYVNIFIEPRLYTYGTNKIISIGSGFWGIDKLNETNPFLVTIGISF